MDATPNNQQGIDADAAATDAVKETVDEMEPEITALGQDVAEVKQRLDALERMLGIGTGIGRQQIPLFLSQIPQPED